MKNIRIGNDIKIEWSLYDGGSAFILEGRDVKVYLKDKYGRKEITDYVISGNMLTWTFLGKNQRRTGAYSLELVVNENENGMITTDACQFVNLVHCSCDVAGSDDNGVSTETIELRSQLSVGGSSGEGGGSYDDTAIWKAVNNKVDKVVGKGLSTNDYTDADKSKLARLENYDDTKLKEEIAETYATKDYVNEAVGNAGGGGGGCECATPDWNAPEGKEGHILNRTHYRDNPIEDGSYDESNLSWGDTREIYPYGHKYYKVTINGESHIIDFVGKDWPQYDFEKDEQNKLEYDLQFDNNVGLKLSFFQNGGGYPRLVLEYYPTDPAAPETIDVNITDYAVDFKRLSDEFIPDTIARKSELTELSAEVSGLSERIDNLPSAESSLFEVVYGETPYNDIIAASKARKHVICYYKNFIYNLTKCQEGYDLKFSCADLEVLTIICNVNGGWSASNAGHEIIINKVTSISDKSTDTQYPSAKAVYDALQNVGGGASTKRFASLYETTIDTETDRLDLITLVPNILDNKDFVIETELTAGDGTTARNMSVNFSSKNASFNCCRINGLNKQSYQTFYLVKIHIGNDWRFDSSCYVECFNNSWNNEQKADGLQGLNLFIYQKNAYPIDTMYINFPFKPGDKIRIYGK